MPTENTQDHQTQQEDDRAELLIKVTGAVMAVLFFFPLCIALNV